MPGNAASHIESPTAVWRPLTVALAAFVVAACGGRGIDSGDGGGPTPPAGGVDCSQTRLKQAVVDTTYEWYLFPELLPATINPAPKTSSSRPVCNATD